MPDFSTLNPATLLLGVAIPALMVVIALILVIAGFVEQAKMERRSQWQTVAGKILESDIIRRHDGRFVLKVRYEYEVDGQRYENDRLFTGQQNVSFGQITAQERIAPYPVGQATLIHYNPQNPSEAFIEARSLSTYFFIGAAAMIAAALLFAINAWAIQLFASG